MERLHRDPLLFPPRIQRGKARVGAPAGRGQPGGGTAPRALSAPRRAAAAPADRDGSDSLAPAELATPQPPLPCQHRTPGGGDGTLQTQRRLE